VSRIIKFAKAGGPDVLEFIEAPIPAPGPREVRIKVKAIGINRAESMWRNDKYVEPVKFPAGLGYEAAGVVDEVGKDVNDFVAGDAVSTIPAFSLNQYFTYGEVILAPVNAVVKHPESLSFVEAASIWMMFLTAYGALIFDAQVKAGDFVIIPAASSSVGLAAIQLANYAGATPIALTRTSEKTSRLHEAGAAHVIATQEQHGRRGNAHHERQWRARCLRSRRRPGLSQADLGISRSGHRQYLRRVERGRHADTGAGDDPQDAGGQGVQHPASGR
jgi:NADPH:quinone reductase-like Zn-dependent oxidoreductase